MGTVINQKVTIHADGKEIVFDGFDFTQDGYVEVYGAKSVKIINCRIYNLTTDGVSRGLWLHIYNDIPCKVIIENNFFGGNPGINGGRVYNLLEMTATLTDGSRICNNWFEGDCCTHNTVNIYGAEDGANVAVNGNVFTTSAGTIRVGVKGNKTCNINMSRNTILANNTDYNESDFGLLTIQNYAKETISMENIIITMNGNKMPCSQIAYGYCGANDTPLTQENMPIIMVNGVRTEVPIYT